MTDEERPHRPNEKYKLSKGDNLNVKEEELVFYYNREHRLAKAPQNVKNLYNGAQKKNRFSLIRPLIADKPRAMLFVTILVICAAIIVFSILGYFDNSYALEGNKIEINGTVLEGTTVVILRKTVKNSEAYSGAVDIVVTVAVQSGEELPLFQHRVFFTLSKEEEYHFVVPFDSPELLMLAQTEKSNIRIKFKPK